MTTYTLSVPALGTIKITDVSGDAISQFLSNRVETSRYLVTGSDKTSVRGDDWAQATAAGQARREAA